MPTQTQLYKLLRTVVVLIVAATAWSAPDAFGVVITDNFDRANTGDQTAASDPNAIGTQYTIGSGTWGIVSSVLQSTASSVNVMYLNTQQAFTTNGSSFNFTSLALFPSATSDYSRTGGFVFGLQDAGNFYALRIGINNGAGVGRAQLIRTVGGVNTALDLAEGLSLSNGVYYQVSISSSTTLANTFTYSISTTGGALIYSNTFTDSTYTDGYVGFYRAGGGSQFRVDSYTLDVVPEPSSLSLAISGALVGFMIVRRRRLAGVK